MTAHSWEPFRKDIIHHLAGLEDQAEYGYELLDNNNLSSHFVDSDFMDADSSVMKSWSRWEGVLLAKEDVALPVSTWSSQAQQVILQTYNFTVVIKLSR